MSKSDKVCLGLAFTRSTSDSCRTKAREFWKFLDTQQELQSQIARVDESAPVEDSCPTSNDAVQQEPVWNDCVHVFQKFGLDKAALAAGKSCKFCQAQRKFEETTDFADTVAQPYEELNAELKAYEARLETVAKIETLAIQKMAK